MPEMGKLGKIPKKVDCVDLFVGCRWNTAGSNCQLQADQHRKYLIISKAALIEFDSDIDRN